MEKRFIIQCMVFIFILISLPGYARGATTNADIVATNRNNYSQWQITQVDASKAFSEMGEHSLAIDAAGRTHIAYGEKNLYYAWYDGSVWHLEVVDATPGARVGKNVSLALDAAGLPHISYYDETNQYLKYTYYDGTAWHNEIVDTSANGYTSLALDAAGRPHISYCHRHWQFYYSTCDALKYAYHNGSAWNIQTLDTLGVGEAYPSIAIGSTGQPYISYYKGGYHQLQLAWYQDGSWRFTTLADLADSFSSLAFDANGNPYVCFYNDGKLKITFIHDAWWVTESIDTVGGSSSSTSLVIDHDGWPRVSYYNPIDNTLRYAYKNIAGWHATTVDVSGGLWNSLALDTNSYPHISYYSNNELRIASYNGIAWQFETVDSTAGIVGDFASLAVDSTSHPSISYLDLTMHNLKLAHYDGASWQIETVDNSGQVGPFTSLALDDDGWPHIAYNLNTDGGALVYAYEDGSGWHTQTVVNTVGIHTYDYGNNNISMALDSTNLPHIGYFDAINNSLKYAHYNGSAWITETVDSTGDITMSVGENVSLALDSSNLPHISYCGDGLKYAHYDGSMWQIETIEHDVYIGYNTSLVLDTHGWPHISYYDARYANLKYAYRDSGGWHNEIVKYYGLNDPAITSLALDSQEQPFISYYTRAEDKLQYAYKSSSGWQIRPVDIDSVSVNGIHSYTSLAIDASDSLHMGYYDATKGSLKYAYLPPYIFYLPAMIK